MHMQIAEQNLLTVAELKEAANKGAVARFGVSAFPTVVGLKAGGGEPLRFGEGKQPSHASLATFFGKLALSKPVLQKPATDKGKEKEEL